jgi:hypothetical protein
MYCLAMGDFYSTKNLWKRMGILSCCRSFSDVDLNFLVMNSR